MSKEENIKDQVRDTYQSIAEHFDLTRYHPWPETVWFASTLKPDSIVLDVGCGNGRNSVTLAKEGHTVTAMDFSQKMLDLTQRRAAKLGIHASITTKIGDAEELPFDDDSFDAVICIAVLHHLPNLESRIRSIHEMVRVLRPKGTALISVWDRDQERFKDAVTPEGLSPGDVYVPWTRQVDGKVFQRYIHLHTQNEFKELIAPFNVVKMFSRADNHHALIEKL